MMAVSPRLPVEWIVEELPRLYREQPDLVSSFFDTVLAKSDDVRWSLVIRAYQQRQINLGKAAELLEMHELELREHFLELGIPLRLGASDLAEARAEVEAMRSWYQRSEE